jgi:hypothetical protein
MILSTLSLGLKFESNLTHTPPSPRQSCPFIWEPQQTANQRLAKQEIIFPNYNKASILKAPTNVSEKEIVNALDLKPPKTIVLVFGGAAIGLVLQFKKDLLPKQVLLVNVSSRHSVYSAVTFGYVPFKDQ